MSASSARARALALALVASTSAAGCGATPHAETSPTAALSRGPSGGPGSGGAPLAKVEATRGVDVLVLARAPVHARFEGSGEAVQPALGVLVMNRSAHDVDVTDLRVHLEASHDRPSSRCAEEVGPPRTAREPVTLAPGASFVYERALDCAIPGVGAYAVRVTVSFGKRDRRTEREVRAFRVNLLALPNVAARQFATIPGLWAAMGTSERLPGAPGNEHGRTLLALVNTSGVTIDVPEMRLLLRVYRMGNPIPCEDEPVVLATPALLGPADSYYEPVEISCLGLSVAGTYEIAARLVVPRGSEGDREIALGRLRVEVVAEQP